MKAIKQGLILAASVATFSLANAQGIRVMVNDDPVMFNGAEPMSINGRVYVPLRGVFERMGAYVEWNPQAQTVVATRENTNVRLNIGSSTAWVNGSDMTMDAPPKLIRGRTMVPLRFLSESLGASVEWMAATQTVAINTGAIINPVRNPVTPPRVETVIQDGTVIPVMLDEELSSNTARDGDRFMATVRGTGSDYAGLPNGTKIEGRVAKAQAKSGKNPGLLDLDFRRVILPDGRSFAIDGSLIGLDNKSVERNNDGVFVAKSDKKDERIVYAGYGAGAGLLVGLLTKKPLEGAILGGALGFLFGEVQRNQQRPADVTLKSGSEFGVRLDKDLTIRSGR
jgi:hypothetical protein